MDLPVLKEGRAEGSRHLLVHQLTRKCGKLSTSVEARLNNLPAAQLERLGEDLLEFTAPADLTKWLDENSQT